MSSPLNLYSRHIKNTYGERVQKIPIDGGFTCPNRDGSKGVGGCTFCNNDSFSMGDSQLSVKEQVAKGIDLYRKKFPQLTKFIVYFQSYSNTYKDVGQLERIYQEALSIEGVIGMAIGTRPDCIDVEKINLLQEFSKNYDVTLEIGVESLHDQTLVKVNRGHSVRDFEVALDMAYGKGIKLCTHLILGFPWETQDDHLKACKRLKHYPLDYIKIHQLQIIKNTIMGAEYQKSPFKIINKDDYFKMLTLLITYLPQSVVIQRLFSDYHKDYLISRPWDKTMSQLTSEFIQHLENHQYSQGMALLHS